MGFLDRTKELLSLLDFGEVRIRRPKSLVFLCGGQTSEAAAISPSVREALLRYLPSRAQIGDSEIILAERATEALPETSFDNLLDLEECIASVVDAVALIVESAGSICELGAFVKTEEICAKLLIILHNNHNNRRSFIKLGALEYAITHSDTASIHPFDWQTMADGVDIPGFALDKMIEEIRNAVDQIPITQKFNSDELGHRIYLTLAFCHLLRGAKLGEIKELLSIALPVDDVHEKDIRKYLDTLRICGLIDKVANGRRNVYYISLLSRLPIDPAFAEGVADRDRNFMRWINLIAADVASEDPVRVELFREHNDAA